MDAEKLNARLDRQVDARRRERDEDLASIMSLLRIIIAALERKGALTRADLLVELRQTKKRLGSERWGMSKWALAEVLLTALDLEAQAEMRPPKRPAGA